jgi:hypothetical protein
MSAPRWLSVLVLVAWIGLAARASDARAQMFRPRTGKGAPVAVKAAPGTAARVAAPDSDAPGVRKATPVAAAPVASPSKAKKAPAGSRRTAVAKKKKRKPREPDASDDDDDVTVQDDDE